MVEYETVVYMFLNPLPWSPLFFLGTTEGLSVVTTPLQPWVSTGNGTREEGELYDKTTLNRKLLHGGCPESKFYILQESIDNLSFKHMYLS